jgi:hypothetical protein
MQIHDLLPNATGQQTYPSYPSPFEHMSGSNHQFLNLGHVDLWLLTLVRQGAHADRVDVDHSPNTKLFNLSYNDPNNISLLSQCCLAAVNQNQSSPSIVINNDFKDLAAMMQANNPIPPTQNLVSATGPVSCPIQAALVPKMSLLVFCEQFNLSDFVLQKFDTLKITRPHGLQFVSDQQLVVHGQLEVGELADV